MCCIIVQQDRCELDALLLNQEFQVDWRMQNLVDQAREKFGPLKDGYRYHLAIPAILGGDYNASNIKTIPLLEQIRFSGDLGRQIEELPDGVQLRLKLTE